MTPYETIIKQQFDRGVSDALDLRSRSVDLDGTGVIAEERKIPLFDPEKDYTEWPIGSPVRELVDGEYQVFKLLQPYNAASYNGTPSTLPAIWSICHTTNPEKAKSYIPPNGTSGLYAINECCTRNGHVWRSMVDNNAQPPGETGTETFWEDLGEVVV